MVKQDRARRTYALILDAAAAEFAALGFSSTNLHVVAERTGVTKGALYGHFSSKAELAAELGRRFDEDWRELLRTAECNTNSPLAALHILMLGFTRRTQQDVRFTAGLRLATEAARAQGGVPVVTEELRAAIPRLVRRAQAHGEIDDGLPADLLAQLLLALVFGIHHIADTTGSDVMAHRILDIWGLLLPLVGPVGS